MITKTIEVFLGIEGALVSDPDDLLGQKVPLNMDDAPAGHATVVRVYSDPDGGVCAELEVPDAVASRIQGVL